MANTSIGILTPLYGFDEISSAARTDRWLGAQEQVDLLEHNRVGEETCVRAMIAPCARETTTDQAGKARRCDADSLRRT